LKNISSLEQQVTELYLAGKFKEAISIAQESLELSEKALGADHPGTATALNNLARLYYSMGDYAKAELLLQRALKIDEKALGSDHPATASDLNNLALLYHSLDDYAKAEPLLQRALKIKEKALGPATATALNNLARLYYSMGDYAKAEPLYQRALKIKEKALGPDHPDTLEGISDPRGHLRGGRRTLPAIWDVTSIAGSLQSERGAEKAKHIPVDKLSEKSVPPSPEPRPVTRDFKAYPRLDVLKDGKQPKTVQSGDVLEVIAGFRVDIDAAVCETGPIEKIRNVLQGETCLLHFFLKGLALTDPTQFSIPEKPHQNIPLEPTATVAPFKVTVLDNATEVEVKVEYYVRGKLAGIARRKLDLAGARTKTAKTNPSKFNLNEGEPVDLTISITLGQNGHLEFLFSGPAVGAEPKRWPGKSDMPDSWKVARDLYDTLKGFDFRGRWARNKLDGLGQTIPTRPAEEVFFLRQRGAGIAQTGGAHSTYSPVADR
jgi:tetratricopeptide (TPR) repeat protein